MPIAGWQCNAIAICSYFKQDLKVETLQLWNESDWRVS